MQYETWYNTIIVDYALSYGVVLHGSFLMVVFVSSVLYSVGGSCDGESFDILDKTCTTLPFVCPEFQRRCRLLMSHPIILAKYNEISLVNE